MFGIGICLLGIATLFRKWYLKQKRRKQTENVSND